MGAGHDHANLTAGAKHSSRLWIALGIAVLTAAAEVVAGLLTNSLALLSDAAHMGTDALGLGMALAAIAAVRRAAAHPGRTFGVYRLEVLAALANATLLLAVATWVIVEAVRRFGEPPELNAVAMLTVAVIALCANAVSLSLLRAGSKESINVRGAYYEVFGDLINSVGVAAAAVIVLTTGWIYADAIAAAAVSVFILPRALRLGRDALRIVLQIAPKHIDVNAAERSLAELDGVDDVHDLHIWTLTSGMEVASAHLTVSEDRAFGQVLESARRLLESEYGIRHATLQVEPTAPHRDCEHPGW